MRSVSTVRNTFLKSSLSILFRLLHFLVPRFPPLQSGAAFSSPAFSTPAVWCRVFQSRVFSAPVRNTATPAYLSSTVSAAFARLALHCWHNLPGELTSRYEASVTRHLLSGTHYLGQYS